MTDLAGRTVVVTGAGRGLGLEIARACGEGGASIAAVDLDGVRLGAAVASLQTQGLDVRGITLDICDEAAVEAAAVDPAAGKVEAASASSETDG